MKPSKLVGCSPTAGLLLAISACCILFLLTILTLPRAPSHMEEVSYARRRTVLYESMATDLEKHGARFLDGGSTSQSLALSDIFKLKNGNVEPILKPADPAVRAVVLYLDPQYADPISNIVRGVVTPFLRQEVWYQDSNLYHFSMFHASHHLDPVLAMPSEVNAEALAVENVARQCCELSIVLEQVVLTSTGVLLGCWQVLNGTDPVVIRNELQKALPHAPTKQLYNEVMLHTSFARLLGPPAKANSEESSLSAFRRLVSKLNVELHQYKAMVKEMWFVEEFDVLALALKGRINKRRYPLRCEKD
eukprot:c23202_g2_i1 orf=83-997(+)